MKKIPISCFDYAIDTALKIHNMMSEINEADLTPEEDTALFVNTSMLILKQIMYNTAIIADYCKANEPKKGGTN